MTFAPAHWIVLPAAALLAASALLFGPAFSRQAAAPPEAKAASAAKGDVHDWPMFGGTVRRNFVNTTEKNLPETWSLKKNKEKNVKWKAALGTEAFSGITVAGGRVFIGTNNDNPHDKSITGDKGVVMCFNEADGKFLWQIVHDKLGNNDQDNDHTGVVSTPTVVGDRLYYVSNRCEVVCADVAGDPTAPGKGKIVWSLDMIKEFKVSPGGLDGCVSSCSPLVLDDMVYVVTSNGVDHLKGKPDAPDAPSFLAVHKDSGKAAWSSNLPGANILDGQWSNPAAAEVNGVKQVIFPGGDGWLYGFEAKKGELLWKFDCNPKKSEFKPKAGAGTRNYLVATPVVVDNKVYVGVGRWADQGSGVGHLWCIDLTKKPADDKARDLSPVNDNFDPKAPVNKDSSLVWHFGGFVDPKPTDGSREYVFGRTLSTVAVYDGLVYAADLDGYLNCLDARTGKKYWQHDLGGGVVYTSPLYVDGKVYMGVDSGDLLIFAAGKEHKEPTKIDMTGALKGAPVAANGVLYFNNGSMLYAISGK
jgi:outer membrane protein assembly factor BamB